MFLNGFFSPPPIESIPDTRCCFALSHLLSCRGAGLSSQLGRARSCWFCTVHTLAGIPLRTFLDGSRSGSKLCLRRQGYSTVCDIQQSLGTTMEWLFSLVLSFIAGFVQASRERPGAGKATCKVERPREPLLIHSIITGCCNSALWRFRGVRVRALRARALRVQKLATREQPRRQHPRYGRRRGLADVALPKGLRG